MPSPDAEDVMEIWQLVEGLRPVRDPASIAELLRYVADELDPKRPEAPLSTRSVTPGLCVALHDGCLAIVADTEGVAVRYADLPALLAVLEDLAADMVGHS